MISILHLLTIFSPERTHTLVAGPNSSQDDVLNQVSGLRTGAVAEAVPRGLLRLVLAGFWLGLAALRW